MADPLRTEVLRLLDGGHAHITFDKAIAGWPPDLRGIRAGSAPLTAWRLIEHMRIAQWDILEYVRNPDHQSPRWPDEYWPEGDAPPSGEAWDKSVAGFRRDHSAIRLLVETEDLLAPIPFANGVTLLREALLVADHNAYHLGQLVMLRHVLEG